MNRILTGMAAGAAGTTALNVVGYLDMAVRGRPASTTPAETVRRSERLLGVTRSPMNRDDDEADNRRSAIGALLGVGSGLGVGALYGLAAPRLDGASLIVRGIVAGLTANIGTTGPMVALGVTDPRTWPVSSWLSDLAPHLAYGIVTAAAWDLMQPDSAARVRSTAGSRSCSTPFWPIPESSRSAAGSGCRTGAWRASRSGA
ncbi:hypothetical protein [Actinomadura sp. KC216]|uniref:hypothetical protein n=1 Tax=Actinomadura sp. KC216 TaxID=2530370 RepID=UPI001A9EB7AF|nr:hypothetical protein [Actinomadura sp. KC216]